VSCKKEEKIKLKTITETDENCNFTGNMDNEDWGLHNLSNLSERDELIINHEVGLIYSLESNSSINVGDYGASCAEDFIFDFVLCPNPFNINASPDSQINYKLTHNLDIFKASFAIVNRQNQLVSNGVRNFVSGEGSFYPNYGNSFTYYYMILTTDSCVFYGKGDVLIEN
jgi:hypothetical protein